MVSISSERLINILHSKEGVTQGDPLSMFMHAIVTLLLIWSWAAVGAGHSCGMQMTFLLVELCQSCTIALIYFVHMVLLLNSILNLPRASLLLMNSGGVRLILCLVT